MAEKQPIKQRVKEYLKPWRNHNEKLKSFISSPKYKIYFQFCCCKQDHVRELESYLIEKLKPIANNDIPKKQTPLNNRFFDMEIIL